MPENVEWFIAERVRALAIVLLTRRNDLKILEPPPDVGLNTLVEIMKDQAPTARRFGVLLRGAKSATDETHANKVLRPSLQGFLRHSRSVPFPVCLFYFTMDDDQGYLTWANEPSLREGKPVLLPHGEAKVRKITRGTVDEIVEKVDRWYDEFFPAHERPEE
jgi:hypothetical protein